MPGRGRGRGRGRGHGRGRGRGRGQGQDHGRVQDEWGLETTVSEDKELDLDKDAKAFFVGTAGYEQHYSAQNSNKVRYAAVLATLDKNGVEVAQNARIRCLAAALARKDHGFVDALLSNRQKFGLAEVLKAVTLLDAGRQMRTYEKKLKRLQMMKKAKPRALGKLKSNIDNLKIIKPQHGSASGAVCRHVCRWVQGFSQEELEFFALHLPAEPWKRLADICHFHPTKDFPALPWFLQYCYGGPPPEGSMVESCKNVTAENVNDLLKEYEIPYSHIKTCANKLTNESKARIAGYTKKLDTIIWYFEELQCEDTDQIIYERLKAGDTVSLPYGKLMERLLTIKIIREEITFSRIRAATRNTNPTRAPFFHDLVQHAENTLHEISLPLEPPIVVIGDRSGSMEVAIRTSTIIASLLTAITSAKLVFFNRENMDAEFTPKNIEEVLEMAVNITATGGTAPAASLYPFYERKEVVKTFIMVTDEEENGAYQQYRFTPLFKKYCEEVYPARLVFVSFLRSQHAEGQMVRELRAAGMEPLQFVFNSSRPDLSKLDTLFGLLSAESASFEEQVRKMQDEMEKDGMAKVFQELSL